MKQICPLILRGVLTAPSIALLFLAGGTVWMKIASNWLLFIAETAGALTILWQGVPIYRRLLMGVTEQAGANVFLWVSIGVAVIQASYWIRLRCFPPLRFNRQLVLGHAIQFLGRLGFVFIGGMFGVVFFTRFQQLEFSVWKVSVLLAVLFSMYCYALELERIGKAFCEAQSFGVDRGSA